MNKAVNDLNKKLQALSDQQIDELVEKAAKWWRYEEYVAAGEPSLKKIRARSKKGKIDWMMSFDPMFADGGVMDFFHENMPS